MATGVDKTPTMLFTDASAKSSFEFLLSMVTEIGFFSGLVVMVEKLPGASETGEMPWTVDDISGWDV